MIDLTGQEIATTLILERQVDSRLTLLVEGTEDCQLLDIHLNARRLKTFLAGSKTAALEAARELLLASAHWVLCLVDSDLDPFLTQVAASTNVVRTEHNDLLVDALGASPTVIRAVLVSASRPGSVHDWENRLGETVDTSIYTIAAEVGCMRLLFGVYAPRSAVPSMRSWSFGGVFSSYEKGQMANWLAAGILKRMPSYDTIQANTLVKISKQTVITREYLVNGHDLVSILAEFSRANGGRGSSREIATALRASIDCTSFSQLPIVANISDWFQQHTVSGWACPHHLPT